MNPPQTIQDLEEYFENIVKNALGFSAIVLFVFLMIGGFKYITAGGDPQKIQGAKSTLTYAIAGLIVLLLAFLILQLIETLTGAEVTQFKLTQ